MNPVNPPTQSARSLSINRVPTSPPTTLKGTASNTTASTASISEAWPMAVRTMIARHSKHAHRRLSHLLVRVLSINLVNWLQYGQVFKSHSPRRKRDHLEPRWLRANCSNAIIWSYRKESADAGEVRNIACNSAGSGNNRSTKRNGVNIIAKPLGSSDQPIQMDAPAAAYIAGSNTKIYKMMQSHL